MQSFSLTAGPQPGQKNYVFVDEHNRHKRLKVMRACEGCRRRKIKCDSATTNTWPCAACVRLKLHCVPPAGGLEGDAGDSGTESAVEQDAELQSYIQTLAAPGPPVQAYAPTASSFPMNQGSAFSYDAYMANYQKPSFDLLENPSANYYPSPHQFPETLNDTYPSATQAYAQAQHAPEPHQQERALSTSSGDHLTAEDLMEHLGQLKIGENGVAPYLRSEKTPGVEQATNFPQEPDPEPRGAAAFRTGAGSQIRIPPELMPSQEEAMQAFQTFFRDVHPYVPVLNRQQFLHKWRNDRDSISPLVLEAVFANAGRLSDDPAQGAQWLALANSKCTDTPINVSVNTGQSTKHAFWIVPD